MLREHQCLWIAALIFAMTCRTSAYSAAPAGRDTDSVLIVNSGSTNTAGFRIVVERSGEAQYTATPHRFSSQTRESPSSTQKKVPRALLQRLYSDLDSA